MLIVFAVAVLGVLVEAFAPARARYGSHLVLAVGGLGAAFVAVLLLRDTRGTAVAGAVIIDGPTLFLQGSILLVALLSVLLIAERGLERAGIPANADAEAVADAFTPQASVVPGSVAERAAIQAGVTRTEVFPLTLFAVGGMLLFPASGDLLTMFVALEVLSLPLYLLCGLARRQRVLSQEAALKYFLLGAFSSAFFLYGVAFLYGETGTVRLSGIAERTASGGTALALIGTALLSVGLLFKVGAVPFHTWIPDVYQGAPTPITAFMSAATKIAAFGAMLRILMVALPGLRDDWRPLLWAAAILTMVVGSVLAVTQTDVKRMLAYSSIAHAGFLLTGVAAADRAGLAATLFYLVAYGFGSVAAFAIVGLVRGPTAEATHLSHWAGLGRRSPLIAGTFAVLLLSFAGIPLTAGFTSKFAVFSAAAGAGAVPLVVVGVVCSAIAAFFYVRVIVLMFFSDLPESPPQVVVPSPLTTASVAVGAAVTVLLGVVPQPVLDLAERAAQFLQ
ncbi:NADH-quinone oxidoreductase subunit NuoN [Rhodococcus sp. NPDC058505]|uniref:NADH-quinone oxidoreductase subunit NuoN n=1 Tax=unclassified Rhodococcus (in: high G+C Gram-positive bacteria) TaxID=192944 RepID=UPI00364FC16D